MKPKIIRIFEINIKTKLAFVYVIIALLCAGFVLLFNFLFSDFKKHKEQYQYSTQILLETNNLVSQFYNIQEYGNLFLVQKELCYLNIYQTEIDTFQQKLESIVQFIQHGDTNIYLTDMMLLLHEKKNILKKLQLLFSNKKDIDILLQKVIDNVEKKINTELPQMVESNSIILQDTVWEKPKSFGKRLKDAFRSTKKKGKSIAEIHTLVISDTLVTQKTITENYLLDSLDVITKQYQNQYNTKIEHIEFELFALLTADQYITKEIMALLLQLHEDLLLNVISLGEEYEKNALKVLQVSVVAGIFALLLITALIILVLRNVRTIRKIHEALALEKQKSEELMKSRHQLLLVTSHDIKTPLNALLGYLELWENENLSPKQLRELNTMQYTGKSILALLNNLLEFSRLEQQKTQITQENLEIVPFVMEIMDMFQPLCNEKKNRLIYNINVKENPQILTDSFKLKQILVNLISNAVKYTSQGEINVHVEEIHEPNLQLKVTISDTGKGIPQDRLATLFEPFTRVEKNSSGIEGSGLGLFVVKGLIDLLKGKIEIATEVNQGTAVTFSIPCESVLELGNPVAIPQKPLQIWVIEDDTTQSQVIVAMLQKLGHTVITTSTKQEFDSMIQGDSSIFEHKVSKKCTKDLNVVFTDLEMGDLSGYEVLQKIKSCFNVPIICFSGNNATSKAELQQIGFDDFLEKPFTLSQLEKILSSISKQKTVTSCRLFSLETLNEMFNNDKETVSALLRTFANSLPNDIQQLEHAIEEKNLMLIQQTAHRILPFCKQINAHEVVPILEKIELSKKQNHIYFNDLETDTILIVGGLKRLLGELN